MRNGKISRRGLFGGLAAAALGATVPGKVARAGEGEVELPREGSYIDGRKVVYIDGSTSVLDKPDTYNVLVEPVERTSGDGFRIEADRVSLDLRGNSVRIPYGLFGVYAEGDDLLIRNGNILDFEGNSGVFLRGNKSKISDLKLSSCGWGVNLEGSDNILENVEAENSVYYDGIMIIGNGNVLRSSSSRNNYLSGVNLHGLNNLLLDSAFEGNKGSDIAAGSSRSSATNLARDCAYSTESVDSSLIRQFTYQPRVLDALGNSVGRALVNAYGQTGEQEFGLRTLPDGKTIPVPVTGYVLESGKKTSFAPFLVTASAEGFKPQTLEYEANEPAEQDFVLDRE